MNAASFLSRKKGSLCIWISLCVISVYVIFGSVQHGRRQNEESYAVSIHHYGIDAREMEKSITLPLEDALFSIPGVAFVQSSSENSQSRVFVRFKKQRAFQGEAVREAVHGVYETLPSSVQRPEIRSSDNSMVPVWAAAFYGANDAGIDTALYLEKNLKPKLESLDGAGELRVSGAGIKEIIIAIDQEKEASLGLSAEAVALALERNDDLFSAGIMVHGGREIIVTVDGRYGNETAPGQGAAAALSEALIAAETGKVIRLADIASVFENERTPDTISRLNGRKAAVVSVMGVSGADLRKLSQDIRHELTHSDLPLQYTILSDRGAEESAAFKSVFLAALQGAFMIALICLVLNRGKQESLFGIKWASVFCALFVPAVCLVSIALLSVCGFPPDRFLLAGIAAGIGASVDPAILCCERLRNCKCYSRAAAELGKIRPPLVAGTLTTVIVLIPLLAMDSGVGPIILAIGAITLVSLLLGLMLLPPLLLWDINAPEPPASPQGRSVKAQKIISVRNSGYALSAYRKLMRCIYRFLALNARLCIRHPAMVCVFGIALTIAGIAALVLHGVDPPIDASGDSVYGHIEFESGMVIEETDALLTDYGLALSALPEIANVQTAARTASGSALISFDPQRTNAENVRRAARSIAIPHGFIFFPETSKHERQWKIKISGDDDKKLRDLAEQLAFLCRGVPIVTDIVLNFKEGSRKQIWVPDREKMAGSGLSFFRTAHSIRRGIFGPVIYKKKNSGREIDVRVTSVNSISALNENAFSAPEIKDVPGFLINSGASAGNSVRLDSIMKVSGESGNFNVIRENRRRTASITVITPPIDAKKAKALLESVFEKLDLPSSYVVEFDKDAIQSARAVSGTFIAFLFALVFCYMAMAALNESFVVPLIVLSVIPPSLSIPALYIALTNNSINIQTACAFIVVSGIAVNAALFCLSELRNLSWINGCSNIRNIYRVLRKKFPCLFSITITTIAGALPFLFLKENSNNFIRVLSLITSLGVSASCLCSISILPVIYVLVYSRKLK